MKKQQSLPVLGANGFDDTAEIVMDQVQQCREWIEQNARESRRINRRLSSYAMKHQVELDCGNYISNGAFIKAAVELGFRVQPDGPNAYFNMTLNR